MNPIKALPLDCKKKRGILHTAELAYKITPAKTKCVDVLSEGSPLEYYMGRYQTRTPGSINNNLIAVIFCSNFIVKNNNLTLNTIVNFLEYNL